MRERATLLFRIRRSWFGLRLRLARSRLPRGRFRATRFLLVPPHHQLADASIAADMVAGQIVLAGRMLMTHGRQPFTMDSPSRGFAAALAGFQWLAHFEASERRAVREYARVMAAAFMQRRESDPRDFAENPATLARRLISWITHSALLTEGADRAFYRRLLEHIAWDAALLRRHASNPHAGMAQIDAAIALLFHALCLDVPRGAIQRAESLLARAVASCILPDGATRDRNVASAIRIAGDLDPLMAIYRARQRPAPAMILQTFGRILSAVRLHRHPDGSLAMFNGANHVSRDHAGHVLAIQKGTQPIPLSLPDGGFERLENAHALLIADAGMAVPAAYGLAMGAGALAFEFSTRFDRIIVNCGVPISAEGAVARAWRGGAAHSTITLDGEGAGQIVSLPNLRGVRDDVLIRRDGRVLPRRVADAAGETLSLGHAGFRASHGFDVEREVTLLANEGGLIGIDRLIAGDGRASRAELRLAFHLHPDVNAVRLSEGRAIVLRLPRAPAGRDLWVFEVQGHQLDLEESRYHEHESGAQATQQITVTMLVEGPVEIGWSLMPYRP